MTSVRMMLFAGVAILGWGCGPESTNFEVTDQEGETTVGNRDVSSAAQGESPAVKTAASGTLGKGSGDAAGGDEADALKKGDSEEPPADTNPITKEEIEEEAESGKGKETIAGVCGNAFTERYVLVYQPTNDTSDSANGCKYNTTLPNGDKTLTTKNLYLRAYRQQVQEVPLAADEVVCDASIATIAAGQAVKDVTADTQIDPEATSYNFHYDDYFFFALDGGNPEKEPILLAAGNHNLVEAGKLIAPASPGAEFTTRSMSWIWRGEDNADGTYRGVQNLYMNDAGARDICLGDLEGTSANCVVPLHDQQGPMNLAFNNDTMTKLALDLLDANTLKFSLNVTGDNDVDCWHSGLALELIIKKAKVSSL